jgi:hypothetical protein
MATKAKAAKGTLIKRGDGNGGSEVFTTIGEVLSFSGPNGTLPTFDATSFDSAAEEVGAGLPSSGEVSIEMLFVGGNAQQQGLEADRVGAVLRNFQIFLNDNPSTKTTYNYSAYVTEFALSGGGPNEPYKASCKMKISGATTKTYAP